MYDSLGNESLFTPLITKWGVVSIALFAASDHLLTGTFLPQRLLPLSSRRAKAGLLRPHRRSRSRPNLRLPLPPPRPPPVARLAPRAPREDSRVSTEGSATHRRRQGRLVDSDTRRTPGPARRRPRPRRRLHRRRPGRVPEQRRSRLSTRTSGESWRSMGNDGNIAQGDAV